MGHPCRIREATAGWHTGGAEPSGWAQALRDAVRVRPSGHPADVALVAMGMLVAKDGNA